MGFSLGDLPTYFRSNLLVEVDPLGSVYPDVEHGARYSSFIEVKAPPQTPQPSDELEALIKEARRRARRRRLGIGAVLAAAALGLAGIYSVIGGGSGSGAGGAASQPGAVAGVQYTRTMTLGLRTGPGYFSEYRPVISEAWVRDDGSGLLRTTELPAEWPGPRDRARAVAANDYRGLKEARATRPLNVQNQALSSSAAFDEALGGGSFPPTDDLSSDPAELRDQLQEFVSSGGGPTNVRVFEVGSAVLGKPNTPKSVRTAAFEVLRQLPDVAVDRSATDRLGRPAVSVSITSGYTGADSTKTVYFDPKDSLQLAYTDRLTGPERFIDSRLLSESVLTKSKTVPSLP